MNYIFDTSPLSTLFRNYYRRRFPSLWQKFDAIVDDGRIVSTREVLKEINDGPIEALRVWADAHRGVFAAPTSEEAAFVVRIFKVPNFQRNIEQKKLYTGGYNADPFVIAKAAIMQGNVVTMENHKPHAAKIPNICQHFKIRCISLEEFMECEGWEF